MATAFYIRYMDRIEEVLPDSYQVETVEAGELFDLVARWVAKRLGLLKGAPFGVEVWGDHSTSAT